MNVENILKVAEAIEQHSIADLGFNMSIVTGPVRPDRLDMSGHNCGTVACIAGWTNAVFKNASPHTPAAAGYLGLEADQADELFCPEGWMDGDIKPEQAVRTLRHLAVSGEVDWSVAP